MCPPPPWELEIESLQADKRPRPPYCECFWYCPPSPPWWPWPWPDPTPWPPKPWPNPTPIPGPRPPPIVPGPPIEPEPRRGTEWR